MIFTADEKYILNQLALKTKGDVLHALLKIKGDVSEEHYSRTFQDLILKIKSMSNREYKEIADRFPLMLEDGDGI